RVKRDVPRPLEALCLKAMALRPERRYVTARALAEDVERWLADEPVAALREPGLARLRRWGRRHRTWVASFAVLLVTATAALAVGLAVVSAQKGRISVAEQQAREALASATAAGERSREAEKVASHQRQLALDTMRSVLDDLRKWAEKNSERKDLQKDLI